MPVAASDNTALNTKLRAMSANSLTAADYAALCEEKDIAGVCKHLGENHGYEDIIAPLLRQTGAIDRHVTERRLQAVLFRDFDKIREFSTDHNTNKFLDAFFLNFEFRIIKTLLAMLQDDRTEGLDEQVFGSFGRDYSFLADAANTEEFIALLMDTKFYAPLKHLSKHADLFHFETQLDLYYYMSLFAACKFLKGAQQAAAREIIGTQTDLRNIMWVYRFKRFYSLDPAQIYPFLVPVHYRLKARDLTRLVTDEGFGYTDTHDIANDRAVLPKRYQNVFKNPETLEHDYYTEMRRVFKKAVKIAPGAVTACMAYIFYKEIEVNNLTTVIEGVRYKLPPQEIMGHLHI